MNFFRSLIEALQSLSANKLRSTLTILGIVIGVAAVIAMISLGRGMESSVTQSLNDIGTTQIIITPDRNSDLRNPQPLTEGDAQALSDPAQVSGVISAVPTVSKSMNLSFGSNKSAATVIGTTPDYATLQSLNTIEGQFISDGQSTGQSAVVVLGYSLAEELFGRNQGLLDELVRIEGQPYRVIGVLEEQGASMMGASPDDSAYVPLSTAQARLIRYSEPSRVDGITIQIASADQVTAATGQVNQILRARHRCAIGEEDFRAIAPQSLLDSFTQITSLLTIFLGGVAGISLVVGGIGIMNIMLVSVTERTREIGLRKAVGARKNDIRLQFIAESGLLSLIGGVIGIFLGWLIGMVVTAIANNSGVSLPLVVSADTILVATLFSSAIGIFFGYYPANRAANLQPVEALRTE